jgi:hypothetical protein
MAATRAKAPSDQLVLDFDFERETKGTLRFQEAGVPAGERPAIGTLYLTKKAIAETFKSGESIRSLRITIEPA